MKGKEIESKKKNVPPTQQEDQCKNKARITAVVTIQTRRIVLFERQGDNNPRIITLAPPEIQNINSRTETFSVGELGGSMRPPTILLVAWAMPRTPKRSLLRPILGAGTVPGTCLEKRGSMVDRRVEDAGPSTAVRDERLPTPGSGRCPDPFEWNV